MFEAIEQHAIERILYGIPQGETERYMEVLLLTNATDTKIEIVKEIAARDGFHSFRIAAVDLGVVPNFGRMVRA